MQAIPAKTKCRPVAPTSPVASIVDELGALEKELAPLHSKVARLELLRKSLRTHFDASPAAEPYTAEGTRFVVLVGPRASVATVNIKELAKHIGARAVFGIATCTLKALEGYLDILPLVVTRALTGSRSLKTFEKGSSNQ